MHSIEWEVGALTWGEPADKVLRAKDDAVKRLWSENRPAAELLAGTATAHIGVNDTYWMVVTYLNPGAQTEETYCDFPLSELSALSEHQIAGRLQKWARALIENGFGPTATGREEQR